MCRCVCVNILFEAAMEISSVCEIIDGAANIPTTPTTLHYCNVDDKSVGSLFTEVEHLENVFVFKLKIPNVLFSIESIVV